MIPREIVVEGYKSRIDSKYGTSIDDSYVAFNLQCHSCGEGMNSMNHLIVMSLAGELQAVYPHNQNMSFDSLHPSPVKKQTLYLGSNLHYTENGPLSQWYWGKSSTEAEGFVELCGGRSGNSVGTGEPRCNPPSSNRFHLVSFLSAS